MPAITRSRSKRRSDGNRKDERPKHLTNRLSGITDVDPDSGTRRREVVGPAGDPYLMGPSSDEPEMEDEFHVQQNVTIHDTLKGEWAERKDVFMGMNMSVYYSGNYTTPRSKLRKVVFRGPDIFVCLGSRELPFRNSWVVANENNAYPDVIFETLSDSTQKNDRGEKKAIYEQIFKTHEYFLIDPERQTLEAYRLLNGKYESIVPDDEGRRWSEKLGLFVKLVPHPSEKASFARFFRPDGSIVPTGHEKAAVERAAREQAEAKIARIEAEREQAEAKIARIEAEREQAEAKIARIEAEREQAEAERARLEELLRKLGVDPSAPTTSSS
jgi:Uma2 family endonuclease